MKKPNIEKAIDYVNLVARDAETISVTWDFDEQQADPRHHNFEGRHFIRCLQTVMDKIKGE